MQVDYVSLRVRPQASAGEWWAAVVRRHDAPPAITALARGRSRIELSAADATAAIAWAGAVEGWRSAEPKPLFIHPPERA